VSAVACATLAGQPATSVIALRRLDTYDRSALATAMATAYVSDDSLKVRFTLWEKVFGLVHDAEFPLSSVEGATVEPDGYRAPRGLRAPGLAVPGQVKVGTWRGRSSKQLVAVRRGQPAVRVRLRGQAVTEVVIGTTAAGSLAAALDQTHGAAR